MEMKDLIGNIIVVSLILMFFVGIINLFLCKVFNIFPSIYLPKSKKYQGHKSPIYKLSENGDSISKYELKYVFWEAGMIFYFIIPIPFDFQVWRYEYVGCYRLKKYYKEISSLKDEYEEMYQNNLKEIEASELISKIKHSKIDKLNKEFNENFIE